MTGDSAEPDSAFIKFLAQLKQVSGPKCDRHIVDVLIFPQVKNAEFPFTLILDDPLANSFLQNIYAPDPDPNMTVDSYDRTFEQNEELGLNDIKVEGYSQETDQITSVPNTS